MHDLFRDSAVGQALRVLTRKRIATYPEDTADFELPAPYLQLNRPLDASTDNSVPGDVDGDLENGPNNNNQGSPQRAGGDIMLVTWYSDTDPANPHNWSPGKKLWVSVLILVYTFSVYIGSSLYTASETDIVSIFNVSEVVAALGLSLYVIGYGVGPMLFSPLSEIPAIGRNPPYVLTYALFVILCVPTSLVKNFGGLMILRFLLDFFGSPCLAAGGASYGDFYGGKEMPYVIALWGGGATLGPVSSSVAGNADIQTSLSNSAKYTLTEHVNLGSRSSCWWLCRSI